MCWKFIFVLLRTKIRLQTLLWLKINGLIDKRRLRKEQGKENDKITSCKQKKKIVQRHKRYLTRKKKFINVCEVRLKIEWKAKFCISDLFIHPVKFTLLSTFNCCQFLRHKNCVFKKKFIYSQKINKNGTNLKISCVVYRLTFDSVIYLYFYQNEIFLILAMPQLFIALNN